MGAARLSASQQRQLISSCPLILKVMVTNQKFLSISFLKWVLFLIFRQNFPTLILRSTYTRINSCED